MAKQFKDLDERHRAFIERQHVFFVASAAPGSHVNVSPRPTTSFRCLDGNSVAYLDHTGSGNETAAHIRAGGRVTIMFCAFEGPPSILRLFGPARVLHRSSAAYRSVLEAAFHGEAPVGARQIVRLDADLVQTSCGYGVPFFDFRSQRDTLDRWAESKGPEGIAAYWAEKNTRSLDGLPTGLLEETTRV